MARPRVFVLEIHDTRGVEECNPADGETTSFDIRDWNMAAEMCRENCPTIDVQNNPAEGETTSFDISNVSDRYVIVLQGRVLC